MKIYLVNSRVDLGYDTILAFRSKEPAERCAKHLLGLYSKRYSYTPYNQYWVQEIEISPDDICVDNLSLGF